MKFFKKSFLWIHGLKYAFSREKSLYFLTCTGITIILTLEIYLQNWPLIKQTILFGVGIIILELINTMVEMICDFIEPNWNIKIKRIKDIASATVALAIITGLSITAIDLWLILK